MQKPSVLVSSSVQLKPPQNTIPATPPATTRTLHDIVEGRLKNAQTRLQLGLRADAARFSHIEPPLMETNTRSGIRRLRSAYPNRTSGRISFAPDDAWALSLREIES
jgi:hypothetical protein